MKCRGLHYAAAPASDDTQLWAACGPANQPRLYRHRRFYFEIPGYFVRIPRHFSGAEFIQFIWKAVFSPR
jgi:hypothetical protein